MDNDNIIPPGKFLASVTGPSLLSTSASLDLAWNTQTKEHPVHPDRSNLLCRANVR